MRQRVAVFIADKGTVLLIRRRKNCKEYYVVPGGGIEPGETEQDTAVREVKEETGLDIILGERLGTLELDGEMQHFYRAHSFSGKPELGGPEKKRQSPDNTYELEWVSLKELDRIELREEIKGLLRGSAPRVA